MERVALRSLLALMVLAGAVSVRAQRAPRLFAVRSDVVDLGADELAIDLGGFRAPRVGEPCAVLDVDGVVGRARVRRVVGVAQTCQWCGAPTAYAVLRFGAPAARAPRHDFERHVAPVAVCGASDDAPAPAIVLAEIDHAVGRHVSVDVDADGRGDVALVSTDGACARPARRLPHRPSPCDLVSRTVCDAQAQRRDDTWHETERVEHAVCRMDAHREP